MQTIPEDARLTTLPLARKDLFEFYKDSYRAYWTVDEVELSKDITDFEHKLTPGERKFVKHILAFFAAADGLVNVNIIERFRQEIPILEARYFYDFQIMMENTHAHMYALLLDTIITNSDERAALLNAIKTMPIVAELTAAITKCTGSIESLAVRLLRMACVEGVLFQGMFLPIFWLADRGLMPGLAQSNELIARDEGLHTCGALFMYLMVPPALRPSQQTIYEIFSEHCLLGAKFFETAIPAPLPEMNATLAKKYIECRCDCLLSLINVPQLYGSRNEFRFMENINLINKTSFFERRPTEYSRAIRPDKTDFEIAEDF